VRALVRDATRAAELLEHRIELVEGDLGFEPRFPRLADALAAGA
jgi:hypothetical protein